MVSQNKPFLQDFAIRTTSCQTIVSVIYIVPFVPDSLLIEHLKLSCDIQDLGSHELDNLLYGKRILSQLY